MTNTPLSEYYPLCKHFQLNVDEACFLCNDGNLKIVGDGKQYCHDKNVLDHRTSITTVRCGNAAGDNGPVIFIMKGTRDNFMRQQTYSDYNLVHKYGLPPGSSVILNAKAYMDDETWLEVVKKMAPGIRQMPVSFF